LTAEAGRGLPVLLLCLALASEMALGCFPV